MSRRDPSLVTSSLSGSQSKDGVSVEVNIFRLENEDQWTLEVVNEKGTSIVWDDQFADDDAAFKSFEQVVADDGMATFLDSATVIPFPGR
ncbi:hypothetical protein [Parasphingorhabdus flavimaris]|uniref:hypothetical protein n=1 Tax=Parasphingorhabdus flavimaris TaxID=266812 RepID=UPI0030010B6C